MGKCQVVQFNRIKAKQSDIEQPGLFPLTVSNNLIRFLWCQGRKTYLLERKRNKVIYS